MCNSINEKFISKIFLIFLGVWRRDKFFKFFRRCGDEVPSSQARGYGPPWGMVPPGSAKCPKCSSVLQ